MCVLPGERELSGWHEHVFSLEGNWLYANSMSGEKQFVRTARDLHKEAPEPKELFEYEGSAHGQGLSTSPNDRLAAISVVGALFK